MIHCVALIFGVTEDIEEVEEIYNIEAMMVFILRTPSEDQPMRKYRQCIRNAVILTSNS